MPTTMHVNEPNDAARSDDRYFWYGGYGVSVSSTNESLVSMQNWANAFTAENLYVRINANNRNGTSTFVLRENASSTSLSVSIGDSATGDFEDTTTDEAIAADAELSYFLDIGGSTGTITVAGYGITANHGTLTTWPWAHTNVFDNATLFTASETRYYTVNGILDDTTSGAGWTTETDVQHKMRSSATSREFAVYVPNNNRSTATTFAIRIDAADGNQSVSVGASGTGWFQDTSNTDNLAPTDLINYRSTTGTGSGDCGIHNIQIQMETVSGFADYVASSPETTNKWDFNFGETNYSAYSGGGGNQTEGVCEHKTRGPNVAAHHLEVNAIVNTINGSTTFRTRKNAANGNQSVSIGASTTGRFEDKTSVDSLTSGDDFNYQTVSGGSSGACQIGSASVLLEEALSGIREVTASKDLDLTATSYEQVDGMATVPGAGNYLAVFTMQVKYPTTAVFSTLWASLYVGGTAQTHTERELYLDDSLDAARNVITTHCYINPSAGQMVEIRYKRDTAPQYWGAKRTLTLFPSDSGNFTQATDTVDDTLNSSSYTLVDNMSITPGAGTYLCVFSTSADGISGSELNFAIHVNDVIVAHTERTMTQESSIANTEIPILIAAKVEPTAGQTVRIYWKNTGTAGNIVCHERTLTTVKVASADIKEATATDNQAKTNTTYELIPNMTLTPGAADYLAFFGGSQFNGTLTANNNIFYSFYVNSVQDTQSEREFMQEESVDDSDMWVFDAGKLAGVGAAEDVEVQWKASTTTSRTIRERTLVLIREATEEGIVDESGSSVGLAIY